MFVLTGSFYSYRKTLVLSMLKMRTVARRFMRSHCVQWRCHCVAAMMLAFALRAPRRSAFLGRRGITVRTPPWCDRGLRKAYSQHILKELQAILKLRLHYNELAQRTATVWRYLTFGDIRCYTLKKSDECDH